MGTCNITAVHAARNVWRNNKGAWISRARAEPALIKKKYINVSSNFVFNLLTFHTRKKIVNFISLRRRRDGVFTRTQACPLSAQNTLTESSILRPPTPRQNLQGLITRAALLLTSTLPHISHTCLPYSLKAIFLFASGPEN